MSLLIKGMKMPHSCLDCKFHSCGSINGWEVICDITGYRVGFWGDKKWDNGWRSSRCPLVEVPSPHGRLIDADEVPYFASSPWKAIATQSEIEKMPTIIEAEEGAEE